MKEVTINGVSYLPASVLAREFRYTTDYIGQLCRAKKVDAQLVGRSWYVNPLSLNAHKSTKYAKPVSSEKAINNNDKVEISRIAVESSLTKNTIKSVQAAPQNFARRIEWKPAKYEDDEGDLYPQIKREIDPVRVHVGLADSTPVSIKTSAKTIDLIAEELPTVSLKGKLNVSSLEQDFETLTEDVFDEEVPVEKPIKQESIQNSLTKPLNRPIKKRFHTPLHKLPASTAVVSGAVNEVAISAGDATPRVLRITYTLVTATLALVLVTLLFSESYVRADALSTESGLNFSTTSFLALVSQFLQ